MKQDGLFVLPYNQHDYIVISIAFFGTVFRLFLVEKNKANRQSLTFRDYISTVSLSAIMTIGLYELAISKQWKIQELYLPFALIIVSSKILTDWLFMSKDGKVFIIATVKTVIERVLNNLGYTKK